MGSKASRHDSNGGELLSEEMIDELREDTGFTEEELRNWHSNFYKDCPDGKLTLKQFEHEYAKIMGKPTHRTADYVKHMFNVYDQDKNQFIDFKEFVMALSAASVVNRVRLVETLFHVFDLDSDGKITREEIGKMLHTLVDVTHSNRKHRHPHSIQPDQTKESDLQRRIDDAFNELNGNDDDHITKDEFIDWYMKSGLLSAATSNEISVRDTSRLQQLGRRSRKVNKQRLENGKKSEALSHMLERRPKTSSDDDEAVEVMDQAPVERATAESDETDSHTSKENERWQHLFNSVFEKIRAQRLHDQHQHKIDGSLPRRTSRDASHRAEAFSH